MPVLKKDVSKKNTSQKILSSGAEAIIFIDDSKKDSVIKSRIEKSYRHKDIDYALRKQRTKKELKILKSLENFGFSPKVMSNTDFEIEMENIQGIQLKKVLDKDPKLGLLIGKNLTIMHDLNIIHGDLTTSNMILKSSKQNGKNESKLFFIDFGLSMHSSKIEDKAVDIHVFKQALESKHYKIFKKSYNYFIKGYNPKNKKEILGRLEVVESRGRYKAKI